MLTTVGRQVSDAAAESSHSELVRAALEGATPALMSTM